MDSESRQSEMDESQLSNPPPSDSDLSDSESEADQTQGQVPEQQPQEQIEWLATTRARRSTAGNRMKSMLANEDPDDDLELLFAEDENDQGFSDAGEDASDVQMDSSSDDEDEANAGDDLEGEKELERQAIEKRAAQRKRKAQEAIPAKFRKKVRIDTTASDTSTPTPAPATAPRPKKKSERASWLPSPADLPTRASSRKTTRMSKEQLHQQMVEREEKRLKQLAQMQKKAAKMEALKKPPMTQEDRLREAAIVEKRNSKSLNRWEVAEKQREEERRAKLAALHQRTLKGPVITFWSGIGEARRVVIEEEKPKKRRADKGTKENDKTKSKITGKDKEAETEAAGNISAQKEDASPQEQHPSTALPATETVDKPLHPNSAQPQTSTITPLIAFESSQSNESKAAVKENPEGKPTIEDTQPHPSPLSMPLPAVTTSSTNAVSAPTMTPTTSNADSRPRLMAMPPLPPPPSGVLSAPLSASLQLSPLATPSGVDNARSLETNSKPSGVLAAPVLAPPPSMSVDFHTNLAPKSNILAPPNTSQHTPALALTSMQGPAQHLITNASTTTSRFIPKDVTIENIKNEAALMSKSASPSLSESVPQSATESSADLTTTTRNTIIFQNFDDNAIRDKGIQTQLLFGRKMNKLSKPPPNPICVITNLPARYRDPKTGLPYYNAYAYREIQRLSRGEHQWSKILNAWVGSGTMAARGVPERFLNPDAPSKNAEEKAKLAQAKELAKEQVEQQVEQQREGDVQAKVGRPQQPDTQQNHPLQAEQLQAKTEQTPIQPQQPSQQQLQQSSQQAQLSVTSEQQKQQAPTASPPIPGIAEASKTQDVTSQTQPQSLPVAQALPESQSQPQIQPPPT